MSYVKNGLLLVADEECVHGLLERLPLDPLSPLEQAVGGLLREAHLVEASGHVDVQTLDGQGGLERGHREGLAAALIQLCVILYGTAQLRTR